MISKYFSVGLGPGQLVGRQVLGSPVLGDIQLSLCDKRGDLEIEVSFPNIISKFMISR